MLSVIPTGVIGGVSMLCLSRNPKYVFAIIDFIGLAGIEVKIQHGLAAWLLGAVGC